MKELRFHPQFRSLILSTAEDSFNVFRANLDPDFVAPEEPQDDEYDPEIVPVQEEEGEDESDDEEESKETDSTKISVTKKAEEERQGRELQRVDYELESDEDMDAENERISRQTK